MHKLCSNVNPIEVVYKVKTTWKISYGIVLLHENAHTHKEPMQLKISFENSSGMSSVTYLFTSDLNFSPCEFILFLIWRKFLEKLEMLFTKQQLQLNGDVKEFVWKWFSEQHQDFYVNTVVCMVPYCNKCLNNLW